MTAQLTARPLRRTEDLATHVELDLFNEFRRIPLAELDVNDYSVCARISKVIFEDGRKHSGSWAYTTFYNTPTGLQLADVRVSGRYGDVVASCPKEVA